MHDLVIFDCDGVLVDSEVVSNTVLAANLQRHGLSLTVRECMAQFVGGTMAGVHLQAREMGAALPDSWVEDVYAEIYAALRTATPLVEGVEALLDRLESAGVRFCVASNGSPEKMQITLGQNNMMHRFKDAMFSAHVLGTAKPDPDLFIAASTAMGGRRPIVIEDSPSGALAAQRAGYRCLGFAPHDDGARLAALGAEVFQDMAQVPGLIGL